MTARGGVMTKEGIADIVRQLLEAERERLINDHYSDNVRSTCDGCRRLSLIQQELDEGIVFSHPRKVPDQIWGGY